MPLEFRHVQRCDRCEGHVMCEYVRREARLAVERMNRLAAESGHKMPDCELVLDCQSFWPRTKKRG